LRKGSKTSHQRHKLLINEKMIFTNFLDREWSNLASKYPSSFERGFLNFPYKNLELTQKYDVVRKELENANNHWKKFEIHKDELTDELLARNQEIMNSIKDIKMEVYELNRKIDIQSENPKTGKINAEIFEKYYAEKWKKLDALLKKYTDQNANLKKQIIQAKKKLEKKDKSNELEFIDFHKLQIENKKYVKEVDEKNKLLLKLKMTIGKITQDRNICKEKLNAKIKELDKTKKSNEEQKQTIQKIENDLGKQKKEAAKIEEQTRALNEKHIKRHLITIDHHVKQKKIEEDLVSIMEILQKKLEIERIRAGGGNKEESKNNDLENSY